MENKNQIISNALKVNKTIGFIISMKMFIWTSLWGLVVNLPIFILKINNQQEEVSTFWRFVFYIIFIFLIALICQTIYFSYKHLITFKKIINRFGKDEERIKIVAKYLKKPLLDSGQKTFVEYFKLSKSRWYYYFPFFGVLTMFLSLFTGSGGIGVGWYFGPGWEETSKIREDIKELKKSKMSINE